MGGRACETMTAGTAVTGVVNGRLGGSSRFFRETPLSCAHKLSGECCGHANDRFIH